ncbi:precorrin-3B C(17)-methyltransferase [Microbispora sp. ATCC PTA-5024]|uniref:precorrin-3B C(17)-methyltransferase n=1 Tax=Microbispora sp. ATCC PTA-5024 TaxID=316330 RepID=UPI0003DB95B3|nr:precorrin-3B C(17)-methyltransferase [Microbispora sp. ATCC PTA-5024]ETK37071.1 precorrin methylase [Microbispora sp. ATCC PTA-5024]
MTTGLVTATRAGRTAADRLAEHWADTRHYAVADLARAWRECDEIVCFLAVGAAVRLIAPLLGDKRTDPGVVCVDEAGRFAVAVAGGHAGGANGLAHRVADALGARPVVTTATDATGTSPLDEIGMPVEGDVAAVTRAMLDGDEVALVSDATWPLPPLPVTAMGGGRGAPCVLVTDRLVETPRPAVVVRPPSLVVGVGGSRGVTAEEVLALVASTLGEAGLASASIARLATADVKAGEPGIVAAARALGVPLVAHPAGRLAEVDVPNPSEVVREAVGTPSVAEAAALADGGDLVVPKRKSAMATAAVARIRPRGRLAIVGLGPGARDLLTPRAVAELRRASHVVGLDQYVAQVRDLLRPGTRVVESGLGAEEERARSAVRLAREGHAVALLGSGDAGVYAMASPALENADDTFDVVGVPGVTAMLAASALLGAPLGHDHCAISLSDLHTPWEAIERRVAAAAEADLVVAFYNPRSRARGWQLPRALEILARRRPAGTPVGVVTDASRPGESVALSTLGDLDVETVTMRSLVIVGSSRSRVVAGRFVTPREYTWQR